MFRRLVRVPIYALPVAFIDFQNSLFQNKTVMHNLDVRGGSFLSTRFAFVILSYQREVDKGKSAAIASPSLEHFALCSDEGLTLETSAFQNSLRRLIYPDQLHVGN